MKNINPKIPGLWTPNRIKTLTRHTVMKLLKTKEKKKFAWEKDALPSEEQQQQQKQEIMEWQL